MRHEWKFGQQLLLASPLIVLPTFKNFKTILIEYDGPQLVILQGDSAQTLALSIDQDESGTRWIESPVSPLELTALMSGALAVRDALLKPTMALVEMSHDDAFRRAWQLDFHGVPEDVLPERGALLPDYIRESYQSDLQPDVPAEFHIGAEGMSPDKLSFTRLSKVTATLQQIWSALASTIGGEELTLNAVAFAKGSFTVRVESNNPELFGRVAPLYKELNRATYDEVKLEATLGRFSRQIIDNYSHYLSALNVNKLEVLTEWRDTVSAVPDTAYIGYLGAQRTRRSIKHVQTAGGARKWIDTLTGYFEGFTRKTRRFEFFDATTGNRVSGKVLTSLRDTPITGELHLGRRLKYRVEIEGVLSKTSAAPQYTLLNFAAVEE